MQYVDVTIGTTVASTTVGTDPGMIDLPGEFFLGYEPTTVYLEGVTSMEKVNVTKYTVNSVRINKKSVKHNVLKLCYAELGTVVRA